MPGVVVVGEHGCLRRAVIGRDDIVCHSGGISDWLRVLVVVMIMLMVIGMVRRVAHVIDESCAKHGRSSSQGSRACVS